LQSNWRVKSRSIQNKRPLDTNQRHPTAKQKKLGWER
jgi:hypothetical protein